MADEVSLCLFRNGIDGFEVKWNVVFDRYFVRDGGRLLSHLVVGLPHESTEGSIRHGQRCSNVIN